MEWIKKSEIFVPSQELELPKKHHSLADWDFNASIPYALDNTVYVSAPSSLRFTGISGEATYAGPLCRDASCLNLPQGRIETQWRISETIILPAFIFRNQGGVGTIDTANTYQIDRQSTSTMYATRVVAGEGTVVGSWARTCSSNTWYQERITWWNEAPVLLIRYEYWNGSAWQVVGTDITDTSPAFGDTGTARCGLGIRNRGDSSLYYDDTKIYGPA